MSGRHRYVAVGNRWVEVPEDYTPEPPKGDHLLWSDRAYQDMNDPRFSSRSQHREFMRQNGLTTADDFKGTWDKAAQQREAWYKEGRDPTRREDVARAIATRNQKR